LVFHARRRMWQLTDGKRMPTRFTRYIVAEVMKIFVVALVALTMLILLIGIGRELLRQGLGPLAVIQLLPYVLPISLQYAVPSTALFAVCCVYGRMSADGEISTIKASGISPLRVIQPAVVLSLLLSPLAVVLCDVAVSWGKPGITHVVLLSIEQIAYRFLRSQHSYSSPPHGLTIHVQDVDGDRLIHPNVNVRQRGKESVTLTAREGRLRLDAETQTLLLSVVDSQVEGSEGFRGAMPGETEFRIPLGNSMRDKTAAHQSPGEMSLRTIGREAVQQDRRTHQAIGHLAAHTGFSLLTGRWEKVAGPEGHEFEKAIERSRSRMARLRTEPWRRWAEGFSCFCFVLVGAPLAIIARTADYWTTFGLCFLPTLVVYYPLFILGLEQAKSGAMPPYSVWIGNLVLIAIGIALIGRVRRY
jgi:lipopolysaccharide export system permease protein